MKRVFLILARYTLFSLIAYGSSQVFGFTAGLTITGDNPGALMGFYVVFVFTFLLLMGIELFFLYWRVLVQKEKLWLRGLKFLAYGFGTLVSFVILEQLSQQFAQKFFDSSVLAFSFIFFQPGHALYMALLVLFLSVGRLAEQKMTQLYLMRIK